MELSEDGGRIRDRRSLDSRELEELREVPCGRLVGVSLVVVSLGRSATVELVASSYDGGEIMPSSGGDHINA